MYWEPNVFHTIKDVTAFAKKRALNVINSILKKGLWLKCIIINTDHYLLICQDIFNNFEMFVKM